MFLLGRKDEVISEEGLNVQSFINDTYCTITKAASQERNNDNFIIDHSWEILDVSLLTFFDINDKSKCKIMIKTITNLNKNEDKKVVLNKDEILLSTSAKAFAILSHASNLVVQSLTNKKYFYHLATLFLNKQIKKKNHCYNSTYAHHDFTKEDFKNLYNSNNEHLPNSASINDFSESTSTQTSSNVHDCEEFDDDLTDDDSDYLLSSDIIISRLAAIFQNIILQDSDHMKDSAQLLLLFIPFADNSGVYDLLSTSFSNNVIKPNFFHHLTKFEIVGEILKYVCSLKVGNTKINEAAAITDKCNQNIKYIKVNQNHLYFDCSILVSNNLSILGTVARNKYLAQSVYANNQLFSILAQFSSLNDIEISIKNNLWRVVSAICNEQTTKSYGTFLKFLFYKAMQIISDPYTTLNMHHTYIIDFLAKMMKFEPKLFIENDLSMLKSIIEVISRLIAQFPDSTNLQSSIARLIIISIDQHHSTSALSHIFSSFSNSNTNTSVIVESIIKDLLPLVIVTAQSKQVRSAAAANCVSVMYRVYMLSSSNSKISQFCSSSPLYKNFMTNFMNDYMTILSSNYGGSMNEKSASFKALNKLASETRMNQYHEIFV